MMTVNEVSRITGVSIRALQYYDSIGLLKPANYTDSGYRLYDDTSLEKLGQILLFRELEFSLKALKQQIKMLELKKEHIENLIEFARQIKRKGADKMDFKAFNTKKQDEYAETARKQWGESKEYREFEEKQKGKTDIQKSDITKRFMLIFAEFGDLRGKDPGSAEVQQQVKKLQSFITQHYYKCSNEILAELGKMYVSDPKFTESIDNYGGDGTAEFTAETIKIYCKK